MFFLGMFSINTMINTFFFVNDQSDFDIDDNLTCWKDRENCSKQVINNFEMFTIVVSVCLWLVLFWWSGTREQGDQMLDCELFSDHFVQGLKSMILLDKHTIWKFAVLYVDFLVYLQFDYLINKSLIKILHIQSIITMQQCILFFKNTTLWRRHEKGFICFQLNIFPHIECRFGSLSEQYWAHFFLGMLSFDFFSFFLSFFLHLTLPFDAFWAFFFFTFENFIFFHLTFDIFFGAFLFFSNWFFHLTFPFDFFFWTFFCNWTDQERTCRNVDILVTSMKIPQQTWITNDQSFHFNWSWIRLFYRVMDWNDRLRPHVLFLWYFFCHGQKLGAGQYCLSVRYQPIIFGLTSWVIPKFLISKKKHGQMQCGWEYLLHHLWFRQSYLFGKLTKILKNVWKLYLEEKALQDNLFGVLMKLNKSGSIQMGTLAATHRFWLNQS